jgi:hypothetical protein
MSTATDRGRFHDPPPAVRPAAYWFWSSLPTPQEAVRQTRELAAAGYSTVLVQARLSFPREAYLSPAYLSAYRTAVQAAAAAGLEVGVYDDYNWISGHAGGRTVAGADHLRERHLLWSTAERRDGRVVCSVGGIGSEFLQSLGAAVMSWVYEGARPTWADWTLVAAVAHPPSVGDPDELIDVTGWAAVDGRPDGCETRIDPAAPIPDGWTVTSFVSARCASSRLVNYLDPAAARRFVEVSYEPYAQACAGLLGDPIRYFFFDHPYGGFYDWTQRRGDVGNSLMWHERFGAELAREQRRPLGTLLLALIDDVGPLTALLRCSFFDAYSRRGIDSFLGTLADWTAAHGVGLAGHELLAHVGGWSLDGGFPDIDGRTNFGLDCFRVERHRTHTTVDASDSAPQLGAKLGDSVARAHGRSRCIVEQYACRPGRPGPVAAGTWELTLGELRMQALRHHLLGARQFLFHAYFQTDGTDTDVEGFTNPRFDFPPGINFEPWFRHHASFATESARLSAFIDGGEPVREVALLYPLHTAWAEGPHHVHAELVGAWAELLSAAGVGFDLVDERQLARHHVRDGRAWFGDHGYRAVILPGVTTFASAATVGVLERLVDDGGVVVASAPLPGATADGEADPLLARRVAALSTDGGDGRGIPPVLLDARIDLDGGPRIDVGEGAGVVYRWVGRDADGWRIALLNDGPSRRRVTVETERTVRAERWRPESGSRQSWPWSVPSGAGMRVSIDVEPGEVACLLLTPESPAASLSDCPTPVEDVREDGGDLVVRTVASTVASTSLTVRHAGGTTSTVTIARAADAPACELSDGWTLAIGDGPGVPILVDRGWELQGLETFAGVGVYRCTFDLPGDPEAGPWTLELPAVHCAVEARLNDVPLGMRGWSPYRLVVPCEALRERENELEFAVASAAANRYYAGTPYQDGLQPSGLAGAPTLTRSHVVEVRIPVASRTPKT